MYFTSYISIKGKICKAKTYSRDNVNTYKIKIMMLDCLKEMII